MPLLSGAQARRHAESYPYPLLARVLAGRRLDRSEFSVRFDVLVKTVEALKWETLLLALWPRRRGRFALSDGDARRSDPYGNRARSHRICRLRGIAQQIRWTEGSTGKR